MEDFYRKIEPVFNNLKLQIPEFEYFEKTNEYISIDGYLKDGIDYTILVKNDGQIVYGTLDGSKFYEYGILGFI